MAYNATEYSIVQAFREIENELIESMMRNMRNHTLDEEAEEKRWTQWQVEELKSLERYKVNNEKKYGKRFHTINKEVEELIKEANHQGGMEQELKILEAIKNGFDGYREASKTMKATFFKLNERKLEALINATVNDMKKAEVAILRMANDQYRRVIFNAQVYANTGAGTYKKAIDMATKDFLAAGITCVEYSNGSRHTLPDYIDMALRTANKRAYLQGEGTKRQEWGISLVIMNKRGNPCPKCLPWAGKVLVDDVWSGGKGGINPETGKEYPLMSYAISKGLYHPRCRDNHSTYFPGISKKPESKYSQAEIEEISEMHTAEQNRQVSKRNYEKYSRLAEHSLDEENREKNLVKAEEWKKQYALYDKRAQALGKGTAFDRTQFDRYKKILGDNVPDKLDDFLKMKYNDKTEYGKLKHAYRIVNQYENNSGNMKPMDIVRLHDNAVERKAKFTGKARKNANMGIMELDGKTYIASSAINEGTDQRYINFKGEKNEIVLKPENPVFHPFEVGSHNRKVDSEYKMFEHASNIIDNRQIHNLKMLSEKTMCESCEYVMKEFCKKHPNIKVEVVSYKKEKAKKNKNKNPIFEIDTKMRYEHENNR